MNILRLENTLNVIYSKTHVAIYDFNFELFFQCSHPSFFESPSLCILRVGAVENYAEKYSELAAMGLQPVNSPDEFLRASELSHWLPYIKDMTPRTLCVEQFPEAESIEEQFGWPVFIKGSRQTSRHNPELSIAHGPDDYQRIVDSYQRDKILHWQKIAIREFIPLEPVPGGIPGKISPSQEYRTFWWHGECVGCGRYWPSDYSAPDLKQGLQLAQEAAERLKVPFLVIDIAKTRQGHWIIIECNDAQESGYASIPPLQLWRNILEQVKSNSQADH